MVRKAHPVLWIAWFFLGQVLPCALAWRMNWLTHEQCMAFALVVDTVSETESTNWLIGLPAEYIQIMIKLVSVLYTQSCTLVNMHSIYRWLHVRPAPTLFCTQYTCLSAFETSLLRVNAAEHSKIYAWASSKSALSTCKFWEWLTVHKTIQTIFLLVTVLAMGGRVRAQKIVRVL